MMAFQSTPGELTGRYEAQAEILSRLSDVSIHARRIDRAISMFAVLAFIADMFQSTPGELTGRYLLAAIPVGAVAGFNPRPAN